MIRAETARTTNAGPQGHVQDAVNFNSSLGLPCATQALRNLQLDRPIDSHAICEASASHHKIRTGEAYLIRDANDVL